ncbi:hypothetical protein AB1L12_09365 [Peribacillus frigoritolerans]|uniref:hypothetical protein n=1 Tax=Peribacillus frigoritolerans TaxID=450367 RepID=UPI0039A2A6D7
MPGVEIITHTPFGNPLPFPPIVCQAASKQAPVGSRLAGKFGRSVANFFNPTRLGSKKT